MFIQFAVEYHAKRQRQVKYDDAIADQDDARQWREAERAMNMTQYQRS